MFPPFTADIYMSITPLQVLLKYIFVIFLVGLIQMALYHEGLVNCVDGSQFDEKLAGLKSKWDGLEKESASNTFSGHAGFMMVLQNQSS